MIAADGWFDWAERQPGPASKVWPETNEIAGVVLHSAEGSLVGVVNIVMGTAEVSVTAVVGYDGRLVQFYSVQQSPWANGSHAWNVKALGIEHEGVAGEPLTDAQVATDISILQDLAAYKGVGVDFWQRPTTLVEHREIFATACPSGRIPWDKIVAGLQPPLPPPAPNLVIDGIGLHYVGGATQQVWPVVGPILGP